MYWYFAPTEVYRQSKYKGVDFTQFYCSVIFPFYLRKLEITIYKEVLFKEFKSLVRQFVIPPFSWELNILFKEVSLGLSFYTQPVFPKNTLVHIIFNSSENLFLGKEN